MPPGIDIVAGMETPGQHALVAFDAAAGTIGERNSRSAASTSTSAGDAALANQRGIERKEDGDDRVDLSVSTMIGGAGDQSVQPNSKRSALEVFNMLQNSLQNAGDDWGAEAQRDIARSMGWKKKGGRWV